ncbi:MAG: alpha/beta hydrolase [Sandaracinaceae bacterium]
MAVPTLGGAQLWADRRWRAGWRVQQNVLTGHHRLLDPSDRRHAFGSLEECASRLSALPTGPARLVVLLHGLGRTRRSLRGMADALEAAGHAVALLDYPSTRRPIEDHVAQVVDLVSHLEGVSELSFVTHSLGGVVARGVLAQLPPRVAARRLVMLAPPSTGASLARILHGQLGLLFGAVMGPAGAQLAEGPPVPAPRVPFLVVAGGTGAGGHNPLLEGDDDGIVTVEETKLAGMAEHVVVDAIHTFVMDHPEARAAALRFLSA